MLCGVDLAHEQSNTVYCNTTCLYFPPFLLPLCLGASWKSSSSSSLTRSTGSLDLLLVGDPLVVGVLGYTNLVKFLWFEDDLDVESRVLLSLDGPGPESRWMLMFVGTDGCVSREAASLCEVLGGGPGLNGLTAGTGPKWTTGDGILMTLVVRTLLVSVALGEWMSGSRAGLSFGPYDSSK